MRSSKFDSTVVILFQARPMSEKSWLCDSELDARALKLKLCSVRKGMTRRRGYSEKTKVAPVSPLA